MPPTAPAAARRRARPAPPDERRKRGHQEPDARGSSATVRGSAGGRAATGGRRPPPDRGRSESMTLPLTSSGVSSPKWSSTVGAISVEITSPSVPVEAESGCREPCPGDPRGQQLLGARAPAANTISRSSGPMPATSELELGEPVRTTLRPGPQPHRPSAATRTTPSRSTPTRVARPLSASAATGTPASARVAASRPGTMFAGALRPGPPPAPRAARERAVAHVEARQVAVVEVSSTRFPRDVEEGLRTGTTEAGADHARRDLGRRRSARPRSRRAGPRRRNTACRLLGFTAGAAGSVAARDRPERHASATSIAPMADRTYAKFTFFKLDPAWHRRDPEARAEDKREFLAACEDFADRPQPARLLDRRDPRRHRSDAPRPEPAARGHPHLHVVLAQSGLAQWMTIPHSYLAMTKPSPYSESRRGRRSARRSASTASSTRSTRSASGIACRSRSAAG